MSRRQETTAGGAGGAQADGSVHSITWVLNVDFDARRIAAGI